MLSPTCHCLVLLALLQWCLCQEQVIVDTQYGQVQGHVVSVNNGRTRTDIDVFHAIPFAKPPLGNLRFELPEPPEPWSPNVYVADTHGPGCMQSGGLVRLSVPHWDQFSEDCLHLDIYSPDVDGGPYPVMVWIYGGAYQGGAIVQYPGHFLAMQGVVLVAINYRLNIFGFCYTGNEACQGNAGLYDQALGLQFVIDNIANFGGDPSEITIFGESAGATSVSLHMLSPVTRGMFQRAILESGSDSNDWTVNPPDSNPANYTRQIADSVECLVQGDDQATVDCMKSLPAGVVLNGTMSCTPGYNCLGPAPVVDGPGGFIPKMPAEMKADGDVMDVPIIAGINRDEGSLFCMIYVPSFGRGCCNHTTYQYMLRNRFVRVYEPRLTEESAENFYQALLYNYSPWPYQNINEENRQQFIDLVTDVNFGVGWDKTLKYHHKIAPTYGYVYDYRGDDFSSPEWWGVTHGAEVAFVFGYYLLGLDNEAVRNDSQMYTGYEDISDRDIAYSLFLQDLFTNFVKYGEPTPSPVNNPFGGDTVWSTFSEEDLNVLYMANDKVFTETAWRQRDYGFWSDYMHHVLSGVIK